MPKLTIKRVDDILKQLGVRCKSDGFGEVRVYFNRHFNGHVRTDTFIMETTYYTNDLEDALATGKAMAAMQRGK